MNENYRKFLLEGQQAGLRYGIGAPERIGRGLIGSHLSTGTGSSLDFMDHREYEPGDDLRRIDWSAYARSDKLTIKLYRDEISPHVDIILDVSRSMALAGTEKARASLALFALFAQAACNNNFTFAAWKAGQRCEKIINASDRPEGWDGIEFNYQAGCDESFRGRFPGWRNRGIRILISDLLWITDPYSTMSVLSDGASAVYIVQPLARADVEPAFGGNVRLVDSENAQTREMFIDAVQLDRYKQRLSSHQQNWSRSCRQFGAKMATVVAEDIVDGWHLDKLVLSEILKVL